MDLGERYLAKTSQLTLAFMCCICLFTLLLTSRTPLARDKKSHACVSSNKLSVQKSHTQAVLRADRDQGLTLLAPSQNHSPQGWSRALLSGSIHLLLCLAAQTGGTAQPHSWQLLVSGCSKALYPSVFAWVQPASLQLQANPWAALWERAAISPIPLLFRWIFSIYFWQNGQKFLSKSIPRGNGRVIKRFIPKAL